MLFITATVASRSASVNAQSGPISLKLVNFGQTLDAPGLDDSGMVTDPEATLSHQEIIERFRRLFHREMTPEEKRVFFLLDSTVQVDPRKPQ